MVNKKFYGILESLNVICVEQDIDPKLLYPWFETKSYLRRDEVDTIVKLATSSQQINAFFEKMKSKPDSVFAELKDLALERKWNEVLNFIESQMKDLNFSVLSKHVSDTYDQSQKPFLFAIKPPTACFTGRETMIEKINDITKENCPKPKSHRNINGLVISGLGGIGKSQLVLTFIQKYKFEFDSIIWINAESEASLKTSILNLASSFEINVAGLKFDAIAKQIPNKVSHFGVKNLVVFDSADEINPTELLPTEFENIFSLITSRHKAWPNCKVVPIETFTEEEAVDFVLKSLRDETETNVEKDGIKDFVAALHCFPLALRQAVSYVKMKNELFTKFTFTNYLSELRSNTENAKKLLSYLPKSAVPNDYEFVSLNTWKITFNKLRLAKYKKSNRLRNAFENIFEQAESLPNKLLNICAYLGSDNIPVKLFVGETNGDENLLEWAINVLKNYSLISVTERMMKVHKLVQMITRLNLLDEKTSENYLIKAMDLLSGSFKPFDYRAESFSDNQALFPHLLDLKLNVKNLEQHLNVKHYFKQYCNLLKCIQSFYFVTSVPRLRKGINENLLLLQEKHFGSHHLETSFTLVSLANAYGDLGDPQTQKTMLERALKIQELHYGDDHFQVASTLVNLANAYGDLGDPKQKKTMLERALKIQELHYGDDHFEVAITLGNLANAYGALGDPQTRKTMLERALKIQELHYGDDHFEVAITLGNLANAYGALGDPQTRKTMLERALKIQELHYGDDHFEVAITLGNLANAYGALGDPQTRKTMLERALKIQELHYGDDHFQVASTLVSLANAYGDLGDPKQKKTMLERALKIQELHYGDDHFQVASTLVNLANAYGALGDPQTQKTMLERALKIQELHYGDDHFQVASTLVSLANAYGDLGDPKQKKTMLERALKIQELHYGDDHFQVASTLVNLANAYGALGDPQTRKTMLERALKIEELHYGDDHFEVAITLGNLANAYGALGDPQTQKTMLERALKIQELHYGANNYIVCITRWNLAECNISLKDYPKASELLENVFEIFVNHYGRNHNYTNTVAVQLDECKNILNKKVIF